MLAVVKTPRSAGTFNAEPGIFSPIQQQIYFSFRLQAECYSRYSRGVTPGIARKAAAKAAGQEKPSCQATCLSFVNTAEQLRAEDYRQMNELLFCFLDKPEARYCAS